jgi:hypothetical protein
MCEHAELRHQTCLIAIMKLLWINTVVSLLGIPFGLFIASGSTISIANMQVPWAAGLMIAAFGIPVVFGLSGVGAWLAYLLGGPQFIPLMVALPWMYLVLFALAMLLTFRFLA